MVRFLNYSLSVVPRCTFPCKWKITDFCGILPGSIDSGDYKHYNFGLLFFKRLSDVWEEEYEERLARYHDTDLAADPDDRVVVHRINVDDEKGRFLGAKRRWRDASSALLTGIFSSRRGCKLPP